MIAGDLVARIIERGTAAGRVVAADLAEPLAAYLELLARWNRKINLTGLDVETPSDEAVDRLVVEPLAAAEYLLPHDRTCLDVGSGGGSPAIPLKIAARRLHMVLVESRGRKAAFLNEAIRQLGLAHVHVEAVRIEELAATGKLSGWADVATLRAVRADRKLLAAVFTILGPGGRLFWFGTDHEEQVLEEAYDVVAAHRLGEKSRLMVIRRHVIGH